MKNTFKFKELNKNKDGNNSIFEKDSAMLVNDICTTKLNSTEVKELYNIIINIFNKRSDFIITKKSKDSEKENYIKVNIDSERVFLSVGKRGLVQYTYNLDDLEIAAYTITDNDY